ncbi:MAG: DUF1905 domain-containing protein [bacterium]
MTPRFHASLFPWPGGSWIFVAVPEDLAPPVTDGFGRTPVVATVNGKTWETSVWRDKGTRTLLAVPRRIRGDLGPGDVVEVTLAPR